MLMEFRNDWQAENSIPHLKLRFAVGIIKQKDEKMQYHFLQYAPYRKTIWYEPHHKKTCLQGLRPGKTQTGLHSYTD